MAFTLMPYILLDPKHDSDGKRTVNANKSHMNVYWIKLQVFSEPMNIS